MSEDQKIEVTGQSAQDDMDKGHVGLRDLQRHVNAVAQVPFPRVHLHRQSRDLDPPRKTVNRMC